MYLLMPAARLGIVYYESGIRRYVGRLGIAAAKRLFPTATPINPEEMLRIGYLDAVVPPEQLMPHADALEIHKNRRDTRAGSRQFCRSVHMR